MPPRVGAQRGLRALSHRLCLARLNVAARLSIALTALAASLPLPLAAQAPQIPARQDTPSNGPTEGPCRAMRFNGQDYALCEITADQDLRLWLTQPDGRPVATFERLIAGLAPGETLAFAMNAGMYHADRSPVGLYIAEGRQEAPLRLAASNDNFGMLPNGIFCAHPDGAGFAVIESRAFAARPPACRLATQSGPMLVIDGQLHPRFLPDSDSRNIRNGVGVSADGQRAYFAISRQKVNFHDFARFFRDGLGLRQALYLDGSISRLYAPGLGRRDGGLPMGPIIGLVAPAP